MRRVLPAVVGGLLAVALVGGLVWWFGRPEPVSTQTPAGAPGVDSCWRVDPAASRGAHPWPATAVDCAGPHTVEIFTVGQVDPDLVRQARDAEGEAAALAENLMYGQARLACSASARGYFGGDWHAGQVDVLANWIQPDRSGFFACGAVQTADPGATRFVERVGRLRQGLAGAGRLGIECVSRSADQLRYASCTTPHDGEFVGTYQITPPQAPFDATAVRDTARRGCDDVALKFLGLRADAARADLRSAYVGPTSAETWLGSDQTFTCYVMADKKVTGSLR